MMIGRMTIQTSGTLRKRYPKRLPPSVQDNKRRNNVIDSMEKLMKTEKLTFTVEEKEYEFLASAFVFKSKDSIDFSELENYLKQAPVKIVCKDFSLTLTLKNGKLFATRVVD